MRAKDLYEDIKNYCKANTNKEKANKNSRFFREGYDAYGLSDNLLNDKVTLILRNPDVDMDLILETSDNLIKSGKYEETFFVILLLNAFSAEFTPDLLNKVSHWFQIGITNWAHCDVLCRDILSPLLENNIIDIINLEDWKTAKNKFQRRAVPVALIPLIKTTDDLASLFSFIEPLMMDKQREVQQGLGWFLREAWKKDRKSTEKILMKWKNEAPRLIFQYAAEKMTEEERERFRRENSK
ncbi:MAG: DNA alkylation repair protein [Candidatus Aminicenantes bacterium]|nr:DNA alkylation repair protein [Candidatus Aminicenantes bacterium]